MNPRRTLNNYIFIKLDKENNSIRLKNGCELFIDTTFDAEKHATVTGEVFGLPSHLSYTGKPDAMPWQTPMEIQMGDKVIVYYLSVVNALNPKNKRYLLEGEDRYVFIPYQFIYSVIRGEKIIPVNGYALIEPVEDPAITQERERMKALGMELVVMNQRIKSQVTYGIVRYLGVPNRQYIEDFHSDDGVGIAVGDTIIMKRTTDIPLQYELHAKIDGGKKYLRIQRRNILAKL